MIRHLVFIKGSGSRFFQLRCRPFSVCSDGIAKNSKGDDSHCFREHEDDHERE